MHVLSECNNNNNLPCACHRAAAQALLSMHACRACTDVRARDLCGEKALRHTHMQAHACTHTSACTKCMYCCCCKAEAFTHRGGFADDADAVFQHGHLRGRRRRRRYAGRLWRHAGQRLVQRRADALWAAVCEPLHEASPRRAWRLRPCILRRCTGMQAAEALQQAQRQLHRRPPHHRRRRAGSRPAPELSAALAGLKSVAALSVSCGARDPMPLS